MAGNLITEATLWGWALGNMAFKSDRVSTNLLVKVHTAAVLDEHHKALGD